MGLAVCAAQPVLANDTQSQIDSFMHNDLHVHTKPITNRFLDKYFNCDFYHVNVSKTSGRSREVSFHQDTLAKLPNGNIISISLPETASRLVELEQCIERVKTTTKKSDFREVHQALNALYPQLDGVNEDKQWYFVERRGVRLVSANNHTQKNEFFLKLKNGYPERIFVSFNQ